MSFARLPRLVRTTRHLRLSQVYWRVRRTVERRVGSWRPPEPQAGLVETVRFESFRNAANVLPSETADGASLDRLADGHITLLGIDWPLLPAGQSSIDWRLGPQSAERLQVITLHYMQWLEPVARAAADGSEQARTLVASVLTDWLDQCNDDAPGATALAWNAYAIASRLIAWTRCLSLLPSEALEPTLRARVVRSMYVQASYLNDRVEWDLRGNHVMRDAVGLIWAGTLFGDAGHDWLRNGLDIARGQAAEQLLDDGCHFERSAHYHLEFLHDLAMVLAVCPEAERAEFSDAYTHAAEAARWMTHPDGDVHQLNDSTRESPDHLLSEDLLASTGRSIPSRLQTPVRGGHHFVDAGLVCWRGQPWTVFFDVGEVGPDYQPGHAHADTLTVEASFRGRRLLVDPGTMHYDDTPQRRHDRGTESHNTVAVDGADSSEVWHIFRVGRRARPHDVTVEFHEAGFRAAAAHDGYEHLLGLVVHERRVECDGDTLTVYDTAHGANRHTLSAGWLLHPDWDAVVEGADADGVTAVRITSGEDAVVAAFDGITPRITEAEWHPAYFETVPTQRIVWEFNGLLPRQITTTFRPA